MIFCRNLNSLAFSSHKYPRGSNVTNNQRRVVLGEGIWDHGSCRGYSGAFPAVCNLLPSFWVGTACALEKRNFLHKLSQSLCCREPFALIKSLSVFRFILIVHQGTCYIIIKRASFPLPFLILVVLLLPCRWSVIQDQTSPSRSKYFSLRCLDGCAVRVPLRIDLGNKTRIINHPACNANLKADVLQSRNEIQLINYVPPKQTAVD